MPYYQRDYVWGSKNDGRNLYKFIDDIFCQYRDNPESDYFIGTLAFCSSKVHDIIDGQQRITSIVFLLTLLANSKCSEEVKEFNDKLIMPNDDFIIKEDFYLTEELKSGLKLPNKFNSPEEFDNDRFDFEYLTLLDSSTNSSVGTDEISEKLKKYKNAKKVNGDEWEFLPLSLVDNSEFYNNEKIKSLNLPERTIQNIEQNTFELSKNNRDFNLVLLKKAVIHLQQM